MSFTVLKSTISHRELEVDSGFGDAVVGLTIFGKGGKVNEAIIVPGPALRDVLVRAFPYGDDQSPGHANLAAGGAGQSPGSYDDEVDVVTDRDLERLIEQARTRAHEDFNKRLATALQSALTTTKENA